MPFCYVGKATRIFFFLVALLALAGLVIGFGLFLRGGAHKAQGSGTPSYSFPDPIPANATAPASAARAQPLSPPALGPIKPVTAPAVGSPPPLRSPVVSATPAPPPALLVPPAPVSDALSPNAQ